MSRFIALLAAILFSHASFGQDPAVTVDWNKVSRVSKTSTTLQVVENPMVRPSSPIHAATFKALKELGANNVRYVPWCPYPRMAVAELKRPTKTQTFWDFTLLDSTMAAIMSATAGHAAVINFSTTPAWLWKTEKEVTFPDDPYQVAWDYNQGTELRDTTMKELADYYERLYRWYALGGFTDELGKFHASGHHYDIAWWEVLNEPDLEHNIPPRMYVKMYDAIVVRLHALSPKLRFVGISVAFEGNPEWFEYFLNPKNHKPGIPLDAISYHNYPTLSWSGMRVEQYQHTFFEKADFFLEKVRYIENIRKRLSPRTITMINELGTIIGAKTGEDIEPEYWNLSGAIYAHMFIELTNIGIDVAGMSQLVGYPTQYPDVSMMDWRTAKPNARYWVLRLLHTDLSAGDKVVATSFKDDDGGLYAQAYQTSGGRRLLIVNPHNTKVGLQLPADFSGAEVESVDMNSGEGPARGSVYNGGNLPVEPFAVIVVTLKK